MDTSFLRAFSNNGKRYLYLGIIGFGFFSVMMPIACYFLINDNFKAYSQKLYLNSPSELGIYEHAAISTDTGLCTQIGKDILMKNGTAIETAIATLVCMGVVNSHSMGLGGGFFMTVYNSKKKVVTVLDARETAPKQATKFMFINNSTDAQIGGLAIAVPGELDGYERAYFYSDKYIRWKDLFQPSIRLCTEGFPVSKHMAKALKLNRDIIFQEESMKIFINNDTGDIFKEGEIMTRLDLARTLEKIALYGAAELYNEGETRENFVTDIQNFGGIITEEDLVNYRAFWKNPTKITLKNNFTVYSVAVPGSGSLLSFMLNVLDGFDLNSYTNWNTLDGVTLTLHRLIETFKFTYSYGKNLGDKDVEYQTSETETMLLDKKFAETIRAKIQDDRAMQDTNYYGGNSESNYGSVNVDVAAGHVSVVAPNGDAVSVTSSINHYFGCKRVSPSTGIVLNNHMDAFSSPSVSDSFVFSPNKRNQIMPGKKPMSYMSPTIILDDKRKVWLVIGGGGGPRINTGIALVTMQLLWLNKNVKEAIDMPRVHHQLFPDYISYENNFPEAILRKLEEMGQKTKEKEDIMSVIMAIHRSKSGMWHSNADFRQNGKSDGF
ncbi:glutathione hydrolase 1 proenzyme-like isoform X1 [Centruroides sculpturatus]|uniref:glutathione hydrolase 1 proenzyme-like isoform X1 n=1 Tax=Centruroides sculpturatus TaxID=218467 RepID=UPI000C6C9B2D|nr:glutathione hydrolase 1 proenzyme-like isoform X1 [Centruroides sculpturatus]